MGVSLESGVTFQKSEPGKGAKVSELYERGVILCGDMPEDTAAMLNDTDLVIFILGGVREEKRGPYSELLSGTIEKPELWPKSPKRQDLEVVLAAGTQPQDMIPQNTSRT